MLAGLRLILQVKRLWELHIQASIQVYCDSDNQGLVKRTYGYNSTTTIPVTPWKHWSTTLPRHSESPHTSTMSRAMHQVKLICASSHSFEWQASRTAHRHRETVLLLLLLLCCRGSRNNKENHQARREVVRWKDTINPSHHHHHPRHHHHHHTHIHTLSSPEVGCGCCCFCVCRRRANYWL